MHPRLYRLIETHQRIDRALQQEQSHRWTDPAKVMRHKKLKLRVKDLISRFTTRPRKGSRHAMS